MEILAILYLVVCITWCLHKALDAGPDASMGHVFYVCTINILFCPIMMLRDMLSHINKNDTNKL